MYGTRILWPPIRGIVQYNTCSKRYSAENIWRSKAPSIDILLANYYMAPISLFNIPDHWHPAILLRLYLSTSIFVKWSTPPLSGEVRAPINEIHISTSVVCAYEVQYSTLCKFHTTVASVVDSAETISESPEIRLTTPS